MTTRVKELIAVGLIFGIALICYLGKTIWDWGPIQHAITETY